MASSTAFGGFMGPGKTYEPSPGFMPQKHSKDRASEEPAMERHKSCHTCLQVLKQMALTLVISKHPGTLYQDASNTHSAVCTHRLRGVQGGVLLITFLPNKISTEIPECTAYICLFQVFP